MEDFKEEEKREATITDDIITIMRTEINKETCPKYFNDLLVLLKSMEEEDLYQFVKKEVYEKWNRDQLLKTIKKLEKSKDKYRDLKLNILRSRRFITTEGKEHWTTLPLILFTELPNRYSKKFGMYTDAFFLKMIRTLKHEVDVFLSSQGGVSKKSPFGDILENIGMRFKDLVQLKERYLTVLEDSRHKRR